ncbi:MAG: flagellar biosynthesis protein FlgF [Thermotogae bacterium]|nr:MAG: flagellar biosynthesis protein FlgF [Thermotogota bacterium]
MLRGVYNSAMGMLIDMAKLDRISNDLANVDTAGYKQDREAFRAILDRMIVCIESEPARRSVLATAIGNLEHAVVLDEVVVDFTEGALENTKVPTHLAIDGDGLFAVERNGRVFYTRDGEFTLDSHGFLVTKSGDRVLDVNGNPMRFLDGYCFDEEGNLRDRNGNVVTKIGVYTFDDPRRLEKFGNNYFYETERSGRARPSQNFRILVGYVEKSNVEVVKAMVGMINALRHYETSQRAILVNDETLGRLINNVATLR